MDYNFSYNVTNRHAEMKLKQCRYVIIKSRGFSSTAKLQQLLSAGVYIVIDR